MFLATLKELNLFVLPKPSFDIPASEYPICCSQPRTCDSDLSRISYTFNMPETSSNSGAIKERRRNTIAVPCSEQSYWLPVSSDMLRPLSTQGESFHSIGELREPKARFSNGTASMVHTRSSESIRTSSGAKVRIVTPANTPSSIRRRLREDLSLYDCSPSRDKSRVDGSRTKGQKSCENKGNMHYGLSWKGKEKRKSAPPSLPSALAQTNEPISLIRLPPPVVQKYQNRLRPHSDIVPNVSYPSKLFELDLSPIIEDVHAFSDQLPTSFIDADSLDGPLDSSTSSYGELLPTKTTDYFGLSKYFGELYHGNRDEKSRWTETVANQEWQGLTLTSIHEERVKNKEQRLPVDVLPKLTLAPDLRCSAEFINFDVGFLQERPNGELPWSSGDTFSVSEAQERRSPPPVDCSCSYQTMDLAIASSPVDRDISELDRSRDRPSRVDGSASLIAQSYTGSARPPATRPGNRISRLAQNVFRRIKLLSFSGTRQQRRDNNSKDGKEMRSLRRVTRVFSIRSGPKCRDSTAIDNPTEEALKKKRVTDNGLTDEGPQRWRHTLISFVRRA